MGAPLCLKERFGPSVKESLELRCEAQVFHVRQVPGKSRSPPDRGLENAFQVAHRLGHLDKGAAVGTDHLLVAWDEFIGLLHMQIDSCLSGLTLESRVPITD